MGCHTWFFRPIKKGEDSDSYCAYSKSGYTDKDTPHDLFTIGGYPKDTLFSLNETLKFIENNNKNILFSDDWENELNKFWQENPNGLIEFD